jgi:hypothetical protein
MGKTLVFGRVFFLFYREIFYAQHRQREYAKRHCRVGFLSPEFCMVKSNDRTAEEKKHVATATRRRRFFTMIGKSFARRT